MTTRIKPFKNKNECLLTEADDLQGITALCIDSLSKHAGKQAIYSIDELPRFMDDVTAYFQMLHDSNEDTDPSKQLFPSIESLCLFLGMTRKTFAIYAKRNADWSEAIEQTRNAIAAVKVQLASHGRIPPLVHVFDLTNNFSYYNTSEFRISAETSPTTDTPHISESQITQLLESDETPQLPE